MPNRKLAKLGRKSSHRVSMLRTMCGQLIMHDSIKTTVAKAKALRPIVEGLISLSKTGNLHCKRKAFDYLRTSESVARLFSVMPKRYADRNGGYCRITKLHNRVGDDAPIARIQLIDEPVETSRVRKAARNFLIKERLQWKKDYYYKKRHGITFQNPLNEERSSDVQQKE